MRAVLLIGHGALNKASGAAMIRHAALLRQQGLAEISAAGFLNFSRPTFAEALTRCLDKGATQLIVQPYFLIDGYYVNKSLKDLVVQAEQDYPRVSFSMTEAFGKHPALVQLVIKRLKEAEEQDTRRSAIVLMAHGTPHEAANAPIYEVAKAVASDLSRPVKVAFMECNSPNISQAITDFAGQGFEQITAVPYFLQAGRHVRKDLPGIIQEAKEQYPKVDIRLSQALGYDPLLIEVIKDRLLGVAR